MSINTFFVLTGGPGAGKTTLIDALKARGYATTEEAGRGVIREEAGFGGDALPWIDRERFAERMFEWELRSYRDAERRGGPVFFDRGLPDTIGYLRLEGLEVPAWMEEEAWRLRYNARVFIAPPWKEIYGGDEERRQSWDRGADFRGYGANLCRVRLRTGRAAASQHCPPHGVPDRLGRNCGPGQLRAPYPIRHRVAPSARLDESQPD